VDTHVIEGQAVRREGGRVHLLEARLDSLPAFRTFRGWADHWDDPGTLLVAENVLKLDWEVYIAISVEEVFLDWSVPSWKVVLHAAAPSAPDPAVLEAALDLMNVNVEELSRKDRGPSMVEALIAYGATATLAEFYCTVPRSGVLAAMAESTGAMANLALYLNAPVNQLGLTGWDFLKGLVPPPEKVNVASA
jgi:hypothetical protein